MRRLSFAGLALVLAACGARSTDTSGTDASPGFDATVLAPDVATALHDAAAPDITYPTGDANSVADVAIPTAAVSHESLSIGPITLQPGEEHTVCIVVPMHNATPQFIRSVSAHLGASSHHLIFYRAGANTELQPDMRECLGFSGIRDFTHLDTPVLIAQQPEAQIQMPEGVGLRINTQQRVRLEFHLINLSSAPTTSSGNVDVEMVDDTVHLVPSDILFWGNLGLRLPANSHKTVEFFHEPWHNISIFGLTSHTHHLGYLATIDLATLGPSTDPDASVTADGSAPLVAHDVQRLHESRNWSDPPLTLFDPPLQVPDGEGFHLSCNYFNNTSAPVSWGESANDEMCFMWAYYYPAPHGTQLCGTNSERIGSGQCFPP